MALALALTPLAVRAGADDQDAVRAAVQAGQIRPLEEILGRVRSKLPGEIVGVKIEHKERWIYEIRVLNPGGRLFEVKVDAASGVIERIKEK
ncbi:MAG: PepSY domain-containing protein [Acetobacteraceae bacterium]